MKSRVFKILYSQLMDHLLPKLFLKYLSQIEYTPLYHETLANPALAFSKVPLA